MADSMAHLGGVINKGSQFIAKIDTKESGTRFYILGPVRDEEQQAAQDLSSIRAAADGYLPRSSGMKAMQLAAKHLRDEAKAMPSGSIEKVDGRFIAMIDTNHSGPVRDDKQQAAQDLSAIRAAADGEATRPAKLQAMQLAAKHLRDAAKATARGGIKAAGAGSYFARLEYVEDSEKKAIIGPRRATERRAKADLAMLRGAALGHAAWADGICVAAMKAKALALMEGAEKEARVAMGIDQYLYQRMAHKVEDSDPETDGDDDDGAPDAYDYSDPKVLEKCLAQPPVPKKGPTQPPRDADEATARLACFRATQETPDALRVLLSARADPNAVAGEGDHPPLWRVMRYAHNHHVHDMRDMLIESGAANGEVELGRWEDRLNIDRVEPKFMREFHRSAVLFRLIFQNLSVFLCSEMSPQEPGEIEQATNIISLTQGRS